MKNVITKQISVVYKPGAPDVPAYAGRPFIPAHYETYTENVCDFFPDAQPVAGGLNVGGLKPPTQLGATGYWDDPANYLNGSVYEQHVTLQDETVTYYVAPAKWIGYSTIFIGYTPFYGTIIVDSGAPVLNGASFDPSRCIWVPTGDYRGFAVIYIV